jgi:YD repeat-containing protein
MVAIVSGNNLGLSLTSLAALGQSNASGAASQGRNGGSAYVNIANGNLVLQDQDDRLVGRGLEVVAVRTYNSQGLLNDDNGDNWSLGVYSQQLKVTGILLAAGSTLTRTSRDGAQSVYTYDSTRQLYISTDGAGAHDTIAYDGGANRLVWVDGATGQIEHYENTVHGRLLSVTDPQGNTTTYSYNANGTPSSIASASGETVHFDYTGLNLTGIRVVTSGGATLTRTHYAYDASGRLSSVTTDLSPEDNSVADGKVYTTSYTYDGSSRRIASITQSDGSSLSFTYLQVGADYRVASATDAAGRITSYTYDTANRRTTVTDPLGLVTAYAYDAAGQLTQIAGPAVGGASQVRSFVYNAQGDVVQIVDALGQTVTMEYDANGNQVLQRDSAGNTVTRAYDANNQLIAETVYAVADPDGAGSAQASVPLTTRYVYDAAGKNLLRFVLSPEGRVTEYRYNNYGQRVAIVQYTAGSYGVSGLAVAAVPAESELAGWAGAQNQARTSRSDLSYDFRGQIQSITNYAKVDVAGNGVLDGSQAVTQYVYSQAGQLLQTIAADGGATAYTYDGLGRVLSAQNALTQTTLTSYDDANRKTTVTLANGLIQSSTYDDAGRLISVLQTNSASANLGTSLYFYDADGRLSMTQDATGVRAWMLYDAAGRKVADIDGNGSLTEYVYNQNNQITQTIAYATAVNVATLVNGGGQPLNPALATIRPGATAQDAKSWRAYDAAGRLFKSVDAQGAVTELVYDGASRVVSTTRYASLIATSGLGSAPAATSIAPAADPADRVSRSFYDADGKLRATLDAEGYLTELRYNAAGQLTSRLSYATVTAAGLRATGTLAQLTPATSSADQVVTLLLNGKGQVAGEIDAEGYLTERIYDGKGRLTQTIRYAVKVSAAALAAISATTALVDVRPAGSAEDRATSYVYDALDRVTQETSPEGVATQYTYDNAGNLTRTVRAAATGEARTVNARYDLQGRLTGELTGVGSALLTGSQTQAEVDAIWAQYGLTHTYDAASRRTSTIDAYGHKTLYFYDVDGRQTHSVNALGEVTENQYNALGQLTAAVKYGTRISLSGLVGGHAGGLVNATLSSALDTVRNSALDSKASYTYHTTGTLASSTDALANAISSIYNAFGEETSRTQAIEAGRTLVQIRSYDRRGLQVSNTADVGGINAVTSAVYDAFGRLISSTDANGNVRAQSYDRLGRVVLSTDALSATHATSYDAFDRVLTQTDALGQVTGYAYNKSARSVVVTTPENISVTTVHTRLGQTQSVTDGRGNVTTYTYDKNGNLVSTGTALTTVSQQYDRSNRLVRTTDANGNVVQISYDAVNRVLTRTVDPTGLNLVTSYQYDAKGQQISVTDPKGAITQFEYDLKGQLVRQVVAPSGLNLVTQYGYDARGKTLTVTSPTGSVVQYVYDNLGRRTHERVDPSGLNLTRSYAYDQNGNVTSATDANGNVTRYAYDADNRLVYTLDALGGLRQNAYDAEGRVIKTVVHVTPINTTGLGAAPIPAQLQALAVSNAADQVEHRVYDGDGHLLATVSGLGEVVRYSYDASGNVIDRVTHANRVNLASWTPGTVPAVTVDAAHDARLRTVYDELNRAIYSIDGAGAVVAQQYDGNGNVIERVAYSAVVPVATGATQADLASAVALIANPAVDSRLRMVYDSANRLSWSVNGVGAVTRQLYDGNGNITKTIQYATAIDYALSPASVVTSASDRITAYVYDAANRQKYIVDSLGGVRQTVYDKNGNVTQVISHAQAIAAPTANSTHTISGTTALLTLDVAQDRVTRYAYDRANRLVITVDAQGAASESNYDAAGNVVQTRRYATVVNTAGLSTTATEAAMRARLVADATNDRIERKTYDAGNRQVYSVNSLGYVSRSSYDSAGRIVSSTRYALAIPVVTVNTTSAVAAALVTHADDRTDQFVYDMAGRLTSSTDALGHIESYTYNGLGLKTSFANKMGAVWSYDYDAAGRLIREISPQVALATLVTDPSGQLIVNEAQSGTASIVTAMSYDALGNLRSRTEAQGRPEQRTTNYHYDALGRQVRVVYPEVGVYNSTADNLTVNGATGLANRTETQLTLYTQTTYDILGNAVANRDVAGSISYKTYDLLGQVMYDVDAMGYVTGYTRNLWGEASQLIRYGTLTALGSGNPVSLNTQQVTDYLAQASVDHSTDRTLQSEYDRLGRVVKVIEPQVYAYDSGAAAGQQYFTAGKVTQNTYSVFGDLTSVAVLKNPTTDSWTTTHNYYDQQGQKTATVDALGYLSTQAYDAVGNVVARTEYATAIAGWNGSAAPVVTPMVPTHADDRTTLTTYDLANRKTSDVRVNVEYSNPTSVASSSVSLRGNLTTTYGYDAVGNLTRTTDASGASTYSYYDALGRVKAVAAPTRNSTAGGASLTPLTEFRRDAHGNVVVKIDYANGASTASETSYTKGSTSTQDRSELTQYDRLGHATQLTDATGASHYKSYDALGHVAKEWQAVTGNGGVTKTLFKVYQYDKLGQQTHVIDPASTTVFREGITSSHVSSSVNTDSHYDWEYGTTTVVGYRLSGGNSVTLGWPTVIEENGGLVRVQIDYRTQSTLLVRGYYEDGTANSIGMADRNVSRTQEFSANSVLSGVTMSWANASELDGGISKLQYIRIWQQDAAGKWVMQWEGSQAQTNGSGVTDVTQEVAGVTDTAFEYNAFGEVTRKGVNGGRQEYFSYDNAGRMWRTNSGDGKDKAYLFDLQGYQTAEIQSAGSGRSNLNLQVFNTTEQIAALTDVRRRDMRYDALGRLVQQLMPERIDVQGGVAINRNHVLNTITSSATTVFTNYSRNDEGGVVSPSFYWSGTNSVNLSWASLAGLGSGDVKVEIDYARSQGTIVDSPTYTDEGGYVYNAYLALSAAPTGKQTRIVSSQQGDSGITMSWVDSGSIGGVNGITRLQVYKKDLQGNWVQVVDRSDFGYKGNTIEVAAPTDASSQVQFQVRPAGSPGDSGWVTQIGIRFDSALRYDVSALGAGQWEYRVLTIPAGGVARTTASGTFAVAAPGLAVISNTRSFGPAGQGIYAWANPGGSIQQVFRVRATGSTGAWQTFAVTARSGGYVGADLNSLVAGSYDYELLWTTAGTTAPYAHAIGKITVGVAVTTTTTGPAPIIGRYVTGYIPTSTNEDGYPTAVTYVSNQAYYGAQPEVWTRYQSGSDEDGTPYYSYQRDYNYVGTPIYGTPPTYTVTTPPPYSATSTTQPNTAAVSQDTMVAATITQASSLNGDSRWVRPVINQKVDRWGNVIESSDVRSTNWITSYRYNANNQLVEQVQPDADGNSSANSPITRVYYDKMGNQVAVKDARGNVNGQVFDAAGQLVTERHADGGVISYTYNAFGNKVTKTDAMGTLNSYTYDKRDRLLQTTYGAANVYTVNGSVEAVFVNNRAITEVNVWDQAGRLLSRTNGNNETTRYTYDLIGNVLQTFFPLSGSARTVFDAQNRKINEVDANGYSNIWFYDYFGQLTGHIDLGNNRYKYTYDNARQLVSQTSSLGQNKSYQYDAAGQMTRLTDHKLNQISTYAYDFAGNHVQESTTQGGVLYQDNHMAYDALGRLRWVGDSRAYVNMEYDAMGNRTRIQTHVINSDTSYDENRYFKYDTMNRQTTVDAMDATGSLGTRGHALTYDLNGNRASDTYHGNKITAGQTQIGRTVTGYVITGSTHNMDGPGEPIYTYVTNAVYIGTPPTVYQYTVVGSDENNTPIYGYSVASSYPSTPVYGTTYTQTQGLTTEQYSYDANNNLSTVRRDGTLLETRLYDGANRVVQARSNKDLAISQILNGATIAWSDAKATEYFDKLYGAGVSGTGTDTRTNLYDANGRLLYARTQKHTGTAKNNLSYLKSDGSANYDAAGNLLGYRLSNYEGTAYTNTYTYTHLRRDAYMESVVSGTSNLLQPGSTTSTYDVNNNLVAVTDSTKAANNRSFINDAAGRILQSTQNGNVQRQLVANGEVLGRYGTYLNPDKPADSSGNPLFVTGANFNFGYTKISGSYPGANPGTRTVEAGESLQSIAKSVYGDSSLWYLVADANGLTSDRDLRVGQTLTVPSRVTGANNSSNTFKPYNPGEVVGNTTPNLPSPPSGGGGGGCGVLGTIIMVVVAAVVTYFSAGALGGSAWAWAAGGAIGSVASQAVGIAIGAQEGFNWGAVAMAAIGSGIGAGVSQAAQGTTLGAQNAAGAAARAAISNAATQGIAVVTGMQDKFSWTSVAASAVGAGVGAALDDSIMGTQIEGPAMPGQTLGRAGGLVGEMGGGQGAQIFGASLKGFAAGVGTAVARGGRVAVTQIATDAFGNALGESWGESLKAQSAQEQKLAALAKENAQREETRAATLDALAKVFSDTRSMESYGPGVLVASAGGYLPDGVVSDVGDGITGPGIGGRLANTGAGTYQDPREYVGPAMEVRASRLPGDEPVVIGQNTQGGEIWSTGVETYPVTQPQIQAVDLAPLPVEGTGFRLGGGLGLSAGITEQRTGAGLTGTERVQQHALGIMDAGLGAVEGLGYSYGLIGSPQERADWAIQTVDVAFAGMKRLYDDPRGTFNGWVSDLTGDDPDKLRQATAQGAGVALGVAGTRMAYRLGTSNAGVGLRATEGIVTDSAGFGKSPVFFTSEATWTAPSKGTGLQYKVFQQEIDWSFEVKGLTNLERAQGGGAPYIMKDGVPQQLQLHHSRQNGQGPLFELSRRTHLETRATEGGRALHPYGRQQHPDYPVNRPLFNKDVPQYWMDRAAGANR